MGEFDFVGDYRGGCLFTDSAAYFGNLFAGKCVSSLDLVFFVRCFCFRISA